MFPFLPYSLVMSISNIHTTKAEKGLDFEVSRRVNMLMWERKMTQTALSKKLSVGQSTFSKKVRGDLGWSVADLVAVSAALGTTVAYLVGESDDPSDPKSPRLESNQRPRDYMGVVSPIRRSAS